MIRDPARNPYPSRARAHHRDVCAHHGPARSEAARYWGRSQPQCGPGRALITWSSRAGEQSSQREYGPSRNDPDVQAEIRHIENALLVVDRATIARYDGVRGITKRLRELKDLPKSSGPGATIDDYETWVSDRLRAQETV